MKHAPRRQGHDGRRDPDRLLAFMLGARDAAVCERKGPQALDGDLVAANRTDMIVTAVHPLQGVLDLIQLKARRGIQGIQNLFILQVHRLLLEIRIQRPADMAGIVGNGRNAFEQLPALVQQIAANVFVVAHNDRLLAVPSQPL